MFHKFYCGDSIDVLKTIESDSIHCCVTSPPYWGIRDYGNDKQHGLEETPKEYVESLVKVFRELRRVMRHDSVLWLNMGDTFLSSQKGSGGRKSRLNVKRDEDGNEVKNSTGNVRMPVRKFNIKKIGLPEKSLLGIPWKLAFALQDDGWILRQDIIWNKTTTTPESAEDRCTRSHEYVFMFTKSKNYFFDSESIREPDKENLTGRIKRSVWTVDKNYKLFNHRAVMPLELADICIRAGTSEKGCCSICNAPLKRVVDKNLPPYDFYTIPGKVKEWFVHNKRKTVAWIPSCKCDNTNFIPCTVIDPFCGSGTTIVSALNNNCNGIGIDLNKEYINIAEGRVLTRENKK